MTSPSDPDGCTCPSCRINDALHQMAEEGFPPDLAAEMLMDHLQEAYQGIADFSSTITDLDEVTKH